MATRAHCKQAIERYGEVLEKLDYVVGLGIVPTDTHPRTKSMAVAVYTRGAINEDELAPDQRVPKTLPLPGRGKTRAVPTRLIVQGDVELEGADLG